MEEKRFRRMNRLNRKTQVPKVLTDITSVLIMSVLINSMLDLIIILD
jgi:hypothetical protein